MTSYDDKKDVARANRGFYEAVEALDLEAMAAVWDDDESVRCVHPGSSLIQGRERVLGTWQSIFEATEGIDFELADLAVEIHGELACVHLLERITTRSDGEQQVGEAVATNLFVRRASGWKMLLHHASPLVRRLG